MNLVHFHEYFAENLRDCLFVKTSEKVVNVVVVCDKGSCMLIRTWIRCARTVHVHGRVHFWSMGIDVFCSVKMSVIKESLAPVLEYTVGSKVSCLSHACMFVYCSNKY